MTWIGLNLDMDTNIVNIKKCLSKVMLISVKQHLSNIWSSIHEKSVAYKTNPELKFNDYYKLYKKLNIRYINLNIEIR